MGVPGAGTSARAERARRRRFLASRLGRAGPTGRGWRRGGGARRREGKESPKWFPTISPTGEKARENERHPRTLRFFLAVVCILERKKAGETEPDGKTGEVRGGRLSRRASCLSVSPGMGYTLAPVRCLRPAIPGRRSVPVVAQLQSARVDIVLCGEKVCPVVP